MSNEKGISVLKFCIVVWFLNIQGGFGNNTSWKSKADNVSMLRPAGRQRDVFLYTCRITIENNIIVGKFWPASVSVCDVAYKGKQHNSFEFEVLHDSNETTSWIPYTGSYGITNVIGGQLNRKTIFVCRAIAHNWLVPGYLDTSTQTCNVEIDQRAFHAKEDFEVLVLNKLAMFENSHTYMAA